MARPKKADVIIEEANINTEQLQADHENAALVVLQKQEALEKIGYDFPYERERVVGEAQFYMSQSAEAMLEAGRRLIVIKECEPYGEFIGIIEERLGLNSRTARRMMAAATKYLLNPALESKRTSMSVLGATKLFDLMVEDDEDLIELVEGGTLAGATLDDIERMTTRELREHLREAREDIAAKNDLMDKKNQTIDTLQTKLQAKEKQIQLTPKEVAFKDAKAELVKHFNELGDFMAFTMRPAIEALIEIDEVQAIEEIATHLSHMELILRGLRNQYNVPDAIDTSWVTEWKKQQEQQHEQVVHDVEATEE